jgi:cyclohexanone monooxygenase
MQLYVFQRTPSAVGLRRNTPTEATWIRSLTAGWQRERRANFDEIFVRGSAVEQDVVQDGFSEIFKALRPKAASPEEAARLSELGDLEIMNRLRDRIDSVVRDRATADALKPWYGIMCKRPCFNDEYLETFNRPNVKLIDTSANKGVERITARGVVANGDEYCTHGFPNWFYVGAGQHGASFNFTSIIEPQCEQLAYVIYETIRRGADTVEPTAEAEADYVGIVRPEGGKNTKYLEECTPGYYNSEGELHERPARFDVFEPGVNVMREMQAQWRKAGQMEGFKLA